MLLNSLVNVTLTLTPSKYHLEPEESFQCHRGLLLRTEVRSYVRHAMDRSLCKDFHLLQCWQRLRDELEE
jgi:hypothetical protein